MKTKTYIVAILALELLYAVVIIGMKLIHAPHLVLGYFVVAMWGLAWALVDVGRQNDHTSPKATEATMLRLALAAGFLLLTIMQYR